MVRWVVGGLVLLLLAAGGYAAVLGLTGGGSKPKVLSLPVCALPTVLPTPSTVLPAGSVRVTVKNATLRTGLARTVANELKNRGFHIATVGNTLTMMQSGVATVRYGGAAHRLGALDVAAQIPGATVVAAKTGAIELDLGPDFKHLATQRDAHIAYVRSLPAPTPTPTPTPTTSPTCRPNTGQDLPNG
jgi:hypothetical protein